MAFGSSYTSGIHMGETGRKSVLAMVLSTEAILVAFLADIFIFWQTGFCICSLCWFQAIIERGERRQRSYQPPKHFNMF